MPKLVSPKKTTVLSRPKLYFTIQTLVITDSNLAASSVMATSAQHQNKVFFIVSFIRSLVFPTTATLLLLGATVYLVFNTFHQESLMGFVPPAMVGLLSLIFVKFIFSKKATKIDEIFTVNLTLCSNCQIGGEDFFNFCGFFRIYELYISNYESMLCR